MNKRKLGLTVGAVALVGALSVGGTLAYLTSETNTATNVFTGDNNDLGGKIIENFDYEKASSYLPGDAITKVPTMTNDSDSIDAYVAMKVTYKVDGKDVSYKEFSEYATVDFQQGWTDVDKNDEFFVYDTVLAHGATSSAIFEKVTVETGIEVTKNKTTKTVYSYKEVKSDAEKVDLIEADENGDLHYYVLEDTEVEVSATEQANGVLPSLQVVVTGYMVQAANIDDVTAATSELKKLAGYK